MCVLPVPKEKSISSGRLRNINCRRIIVQIGGADPVIPFNTWQQEFLKTIGQFSWDVRQVQWLDELVHSGCVPATLMGLRVFTTALSHRCLWAQRERMLAGSWYQRRTLSEHLSAFDDAAAADYTPVSVLEYLAADADCSVRCSVAENRYTPIHLLTQLAGDLSDSVRASVASNHHTPSEVLSSLQYDSSPHVRAIAAVNAQMPFSIALSVLESLALHESDDIRSRVAGWTNTTAMTLEQLASSRGYWTRRRLAENPRTPTSILQKLALDEDEDVCAAVAGNPSTPESVLLRFATSKDDSLRSAVAGNRSVPPVVLRKLTQDCCGEVRLSAAHNPNVPAETTIAILESLASDDEDSIRQCVAKHLSTPLKTLEQMAMDSFAYVRESVARNPSSSAKLLFALASDTQPIVRKALAERPDASIELLDRLAVDSDYGVREAVAKNPHTPYIVLSRLIEDEEYSVRAAVLRNSSLQGQYVDQLSERCEKFIERCVKSTNTRDRLIVVKDLSVPENVLALLTHDTSVEVRRALIKRFDLTPYPSLLMAMASDPDKWIQLQLASCPLVPTEGLQILSRSIGGNSKVEVALANNLSSPIEFILSHYHQTALPAYLKKSLELAQGDTLQQRLEMICANSENELFPPVVINWQQRVAALRSAGQRKSQSASRVLAFMHPACPAKLLFEASKSKSWIDRCAVAQNPGAATEVLDLLVSDSDKNVAAAAAENRRARA